MKQELYHELNIGSKKSHIVLDCDECLALISPKWFDKIMKNRDYFDKYFDLPESFNLEKDYYKIFNRNTFFLNEWLFKKNNNFTEEEAFECLMKMFELYDCKDFYDDIPTNEMTRAFTILATQKMVKNITIVTRSTGNNRESKEKFIFNIFANSFDKVDIVHVERDQSKSSIIKELKDVALVLEDEPANIMEILMNCPNLEYTDFYIPYYGYNKNLNPEIIKLAEKNNNQLKYYHLFD